MKASIDVESGKELHEEFDPALVMDRFLCKFKLGYNAIHHRKNQKVFRKFYQELPGKMAANECEPNQVNFVPERLSIPLLLASRNRIRHDEFRTLPTYLNTKRDFYAKTCTLENANNTKSKDRARKLIGEYPAAGGPCPYIRMSKTRRDFIEPRAYHLPPNIYNITHEPFASRRGNGSAHWDKLPEGITQSSMPWLTTAPPKKPKSKWKLYNFPQLVDRLNMPCNKHKGVFLNNARSGRGSTRFMIGNPALVYREPSEPSPAEYNVTTHTIAHNLTPPKDQAKPNPHLFQPHSCVPEQPSSIMPRHLSFLPAVGRYEVRFPKHCACGRKIFTPGLPLIVDREKRKRFRRIPYKKIPAHLHCAPDFTHVSGHGHTHVFRLPGSKLHKPQPLVLSKEAKRFQKTLQLYHDYKYINMINAPLRKRISQIVFHDVSLEPKVRFNCFFNTTIRKQIHNERKVAFGGRAARFPDEDFRLTVFTANQLEQLKYILPPARQLRDHSITQTPLKEVKSRLFEIPAHMKPVLKPPLRKSHFKFPALPTPKLLVTRKDLLPQLAPGEVYNTPRAFNKRIELQHFLKEIPDTQ